MESFAGLLTTKLGGLVQLSSAQVAVLEQHCEMMLRWNVRLNLTTVTALPEVVERHYCESLFLGAHLPAGSLAMADVGSGAGFPGFPVAVLHPDCRVALIESHQRKAAFLRESSRSVPNVSVLAWRAENVPGTFDWMISRAVAYEDLLPVLHLAPNIALLAGNVREEEMPEVEWLERIPVPWGRNRALLIGRRIS